MMEWLREIFWMFPLIFAAYTVIPITVGGALLALAAPKISNIWLRIVALIGIVAMQALGSIWTFLDSVENFRFFIPFWFKYPYLNMPFILFFWIPVIAQIWYVTKRPLPKVGVAALIGFLAVIAGAVFFVLMGSIVGAETD